MLQSYRQLLQQIAQKSTTAAIFATMVPGQRENLQEDVDHLQFLLYYITDNKSTTILKGMVMLWISMKLVQ